MTRSPDSAVEALNVRVYTVPTDSPESDGTYAWTSTTMVLVEAHAGGKVGIGYTYADNSTAVLVREVLAKEVVGVDAMDVQRAWEEMVHAIRNLGRPGISSMAIAAVDVALWDLKAKLLDLSLVDLLGATRDSVPVYGSGGFTSYSIEHLQQQLSGWVEAGIPRVKMKIGTHPDKDLERVKAARAAIGPEADLYVDSNGAYGRKFALAQAGVFRSDCGVMWFEEPVSSDDLEGLRLIRDRAPYGMNIAAGEYGYDLWYFRRMLEAGAVDVLQADASRCAGITGFIRAAALTESRSMHLSAHCAPSLHVAACCSIAKLWPIEYFHDHVRIEHMFFEGALTPKGGSLYPDRSRPGLGLELKAADAERYRVT
ncbi:MAG TPA: enolase C-terminal domain-like protein [Chloroflexota bacterium]|nr:enolase C-terminal domain-like protein [Chloroflexota bacterium]